MTESDYSRIVPQSPLDLNLMTTNTVWGSSEINQGLMARLNSNDPEQWKNAGWEIMGYYSRDLRLANLDKLELRACRHFLNLGGDCLKEGYKKAFLICLERLASILETSQSKSGFYRKLMNTLFQHTTYSDTGPERKSLFGKKQKVE